MKKVLSLIIVLCSLPLVAMAAPAQEPLYFGAGLSRNTLSVSVPPFGSVDVSGTGYQFFGGYDLSALGIKANNVKFAAEVGYMDSGTMKGNATVPFFGSVTVEAKEKGLWATGVASYAATPQVDLLGRLGLDFGDDNGLMFGIGAGFSVNKQIQLRGEFVKRPDVDSIQFNVVFHLQ